jgi:KTSC domain-containing protein
MNPQELRALLTELVQAITQVMESGEELSDELQGQIAQTLANLVARIDEGGAQQPGGGEIGNITPPLEPGPYPSSNVNSFKYDPRNGRLFVKFHGSESADSGPVYRYENVPKNIYDVFSQGRVAPRTSGQNQYHRWIKGVTPSLGASLNALIKGGGYPYQRMS